MKKIILLCLSACCSLFASAQTLYVKTHHATYAYAADEVGEMPYSDGERLYVMGHAFELTEVAELFFDRTPVAQGTVTVDFNGETAQVVIAGRLADFVQATVDGAHVFLVQSEEVGDATCGEITYHLTGQTDNGELALEGSYKARIELAGLTLTNPKGAALNIQNGKRIELSVASETVNTLTDGTSGDWKGCITCKGHLELKGKGTLNVTGRTNHAVFSKEYLTLKNCTLNVLGAVADGVNCNQYFTMESGTLNIEAVGDDGVQVSFKDETDREAEDTGELTVLGGTLNVVAPAASVKGLKAEGNLLIAGGEVTVTTKGNGSEGIESKKELTISGGNVTVTAHDNGINSAGNMYLQGGNVVSMASNNDGIDSNGHMYISGGTVLALGAGSVECGIDVNDEGGYSLYITGGTVLGIGGRNSLPSSSSASTQPYVSGSGSVTAGSAVTLSDGSSTLASFTIPEGYSGSSSGSFPFWGPGGGNNRPGGGGTTGGGILLSCPGITKGGSYTLTVGTGSSTVTGQ